MYEVLSVLKDQEIYSKQLAERRRGQEPSKLSWIFASHPSNDKRLQEVLNNVSISFLKGKPKKKIHIFK